MVLMVLCCVIAWIADLQSTKISIFLVLSDIFYLANPVLILIASSSPLYLVPEDVTAFANLIGNLVRPFFLITAPAPVSAGFVVADPSVKISMVLLLLIPSM